MTVSAAVRRDLDALGDEELAHGALAAAALELASQMDDPGNSATSKSMCAKSLSDVLERLRALAPPRVVKSPLLDIRQRRDKRVKDEK
jgi:hypothetical protein